MKQHEKGLFHEVKLKRSEDCSKPPIVQPTTGNKEEASHGKVVEKMHQDSGKPYLAPFPRPQADRHTRDSGPGTTRSSQQVCIEKRLRNIHLALSTCPPLGAFWETLIGYSGSMPSAVVAFVSSSEYSQESPKPDMPPLARTSPNAVDQGALSKHRWPQLHMLQLQPAMYPQSPWQSTTASRSQPAAQVVTMRNLPGNCHIEHSS